MIYGSLIAVGDGQVKPIEVNLYPDNTPLMECDLGFRVEQLLVRPINLQEFMAAMFWVDAHFQRGHLIPELVLPCVPGQRQDRINDSGDYLFTVRSVAQAINSRNFPLVTIVDPHSNVAPALIDRCHVVPSKTILSLIKLPREYDAVIAGDTSYVARAHQIAQKLGIKRVLHSWKHRDITTGKLTSFGLEPSEGIQTALVADDLCDGGGTFEGLGQILNERDISADLYVSHGIFSKGLKGLLQRYYNILTTDSVDNIPERPAGHQNRFIVIPVSEQLINGGLQ